MPSWWCTAVHLIDVVIVWWHKPNSKDQEGAAGAKRAFWDSDEICGDRSCSDYWSCAEVIESFESSSSNLNEDETINYHVVTNGKSYSGLMGLSHIKTTPRRKRPRELPSTPPLMKRQWFPADFWCLSGWMICMLSREYPISKPIILPSRLIRVDSSGFENEDAIHGVYQILTTPTHTFWELCMAWKRGRSRSN